MKLSAELQQDIQRIAASQGISPEQFIVQTLSEKIRHIKQQSRTSNSEQEPQLRRKDGILVIETSPLNHIDLNDLIDQIRLERDQEQMHL